MEKEKRKVGAPAKADEDKLKIKTHRWTHSHLEHIKDESNRRGLKESEYLRKIIDAGINFLKVKDECCTSMLLNFTQQQIDEIERAAIKKKMTVSELVRACVDQQFKLW